MEHFYDALTAGKADAALAASLLDVYKRQVGNHSESAKAEGSLTATVTAGAGTKVGLSDPVVKSRCV